MRALRVSPDHRRLQREGAPLPQQGCLQDFADSNFAKHIEKLRENGDARYLQRMIENARDRLFEKSRLLGHPDRGLPRRRDAEHRWTSTEAHVAALDLARGQLAAKWLKAIQATGMAKQRTSYRIRDRLKQEGLIVIGSNGCVGRSHAPRRRETRGLRDDGMPWRAAPARDQPGLYSYCCQTGLTRQSRATPQLSSCTPQPGRLAHRP